MDINYLLAREQISLAKARGAATAEARMAHAGLARGYACALAASGFPVRLVSLSATNRPADQSAATDRNPAHA